MKNCLFVFFIAVLISGCASTETVAPNVSENSVEEKDEKTKAKKEKKKRVCPGGSTGSRLGRRC